MDTCEDIELPPQMHKNPSPIRYPAKEVPPPVIHNSSEKKLKKKRKKKNNLKYLNGINNWKEQK